MTSPKDDVECPVCGGINQHKLSCRKLHICLRKHTDGPCNGLPRDDCPTLCETPKEIRDRYAAPKDDVITYEEARCAVRDSCVYPKLGKLLRFIDQAEGMERERGMLLSEHLFRDIETLKEQVRVLRVACEGALEFIAEDTDSAVTVATALRAALGFSGK